VPSRRLLTIGNARLERVAFFSLSEGGAKRLGVTGLAVPPAERIVASDLPQLAPTLAVGEARTLLVRVVSRSSTTTPACWRWSPPVRRPW
jgi:hypothetical protein